MLDRARRNRNIAEYEGATDVHECLVEALIRVEEELAARVLDVGVKSMPDAE